MNGRRAIVGLCMCCTLLVSAFAAQGASAASNGTTAFTCVNGQGTLRGEHCLTTGTAAATFGHVAIAENTPTEVIGTNLNTTNSTTQARVFKLKETIAGLPLELQATGASGSGWMENKKDPATGEHYAEGEGTITFTGVTVTSLPGKGCKVTTDKEDGSGVEKEEGEIGIVHTKTLKATTKGQGDAVKFQPLIGSNVLARFIITCNPETRVPAIEGTWEMAGSVKGSSSGATIEFTHATTTAEETLFGKGSKAGIDGALTLSSRPKGSEGSYAPMSATTVAT